MIAAAWNTLLGVMITALLVLVVIKAFLGEWKEAWFALGLAAVMTLFNASEPESHNATPAQHETATDAEKSNETDN